MLTSSSYKKFDFTVPVLRKAVKGFRFVRTTLSHHNTRFTQSGPPKTKSNEGFAKKKKNKKKTGLSRF